ncbi:DNA ligase D [Silvibacterium sp.]|uniref:DNA ligase D n=1 Tax=Silvibacterium sp. TaxID=1964179 RepID=UPI0039E40BC3
MAAKKSAQKKSTKKAVVPKKTGISKAGTPKTASSKAGSRHISASAEVDRQLKKYRSMRDFSVTAEPAGGKAAKEQALPFVIQKHAATRLHYDFRLGWRGVLKSWAVAKGPSYYPGDKRLAVQVEDHPIEYGGFEGTIPKGQYGGGTVMLWDHGTWTPHGDADEGLRTGRLKFELHGEKLKGNWTLVRMGGKAAQEAKPNWLLIKEHDEYEQGEGDPPITEEAPDSVVTGRDLDGIAEDEDHIWNSKDTKQIDEKTPAPVETPKKAASSRARVSKRPEKKNVTSAELKSLPREAMPKFIAPQLCAQLKEAPSGSDWIHELKLDGYRVQAHIKNGNVTLLTRKGLDWTHRMRSLAEAVAKLPVESALIDGEVVVLNDEGATSFARLQAAFQEHGKYPLTYFVFDLLHLNGHNLRNLPLTERKAVLARLLAGGDDVIRFSDDVHQSGADVFAHACRLGAEGIVSKRADAVYRSGRSSAWVKVKCVRQQEFVVGGFTLPGDRGAGLGSLLLGYYEEGRLIYAGRTGTGFTQKSQRELRKRLEEIRVEKSPFARIIADGRKDALWVKPVLVAEVAFATWTADKLVRQASFKGLREDKPAKEVTRELPRENAEREIADTGSKKAATHRTPLSKAAKTQPGASGAEDAEHGKVRLTHPDKVLDVESGLTKQQLADYYAAIAEHMMPHIANRPLSLVRCPEGVGHPCFFQKHIGQGVPEGIGSVRIKDKKGVAEDYLTLSDPEALPGLAQMGALEVHPWGSRNDALETPDMLIFDLDPDAAIRWETLVDAAKHVKAGLKTLGLESFVKTTGGKGLHVVAPIVPEHDWTEVKAFARSFAETIEASDPELYLIKMTKAARKGKIFLDYLRNERGATAVAPFSPRARAGAHVALPLAWVDLKQRPEFAVANFADWKQRLKRDPWTKMWEMKQRLTAEALAAVREAGKK